MRVEFEMTELQLNILMEACKPVPYMIIGDKEPKSPQENANDAWELLGAVMGFDHMSVEPIVGKSTRFFTAIKKDIKQ